MVWKNWLNSKTYWEKGALIGVLVSLIPLVGLALNLIFFIKYPLHEVIVNLFSLPFTLHTGVFTDKFLYSQFSGEESLEIIILYPISIIINAGLGALIGLTIGKIKSKYFL